MKFHKTYLAGIALIALGVYQLATGHGDAVSATEHITYGYAILTGRAALDKIGKIF